jgi:hypothetical protein
MHFDPALPRGGALGRAVAAAVSIRTGLAEDAGERALRTMGVRVDRVRPRLVRKAGAALLEDPGAAP